MDNDDVRLEGNPPASRAAGDFGGFFMNRRPNTDAGRENGGTFNELAQREEMFRSADSARQRFMKSNGAVLNSFPSSER